MMKRFFALVGIAVAILPVFGQTKYKLPPKEVVTILDARPTPLLEVSSARDAMLLVEYEANPPIALLAQPYLKLAGLRINPQINARQRTRPGIGIVVRRLTGNVMTRVPLPANASVGVPVWSHDGSHIAFTRDVENGVELWVANPMRAHAHPVASIHVNDVLGSPFAWTRDNRSLLVKLVPQGRTKAPEISKIPSGPNTDETSGKVSRLPTFQDLLRTEQDEDSFFSRRVTRC